jgi:ethanolaminephosphotransferase
MCNVIAFVITLLDGGFDFSQPLKPSTCYVIGIFQLLYQILDNIDGKQARRTGNSTPFGMLMDHGCDSFTLVFTSYNMSRLLIVGNEGFFSYSVYFGLIMGFFMMTYEDYKIGEMAFPAINGVDEGNFAVFLIGVICGIFGQDWVLYVPIKSLEILTIGKIFALAITLGGIMTIFNLYYHTYQKNGCTENLKNFFDAINFYNSLLIPVIFIYYRDDFWINAKWIIILNACLLFIRVTIDLQIKIATMDSFKCSLMFVISNIALVISIFIKNELYNFYYLGIVGIFQFAELIVFIYFRANEITDFLSIRVFCVQSSEDIETTKV